MKISMGDLPKIVICFIVVVIAVISIVVSKPSVVFALCIIVYTITFVELLRDYKENICIICFYFSLFTFLLGSELFQQIGLSEKQYFFTESIDLHAYFSILLSIVFLFIAYTISSLSTNENSIVNYEKESLNRTYATYRKISRILFYILSVFKVVTIASSIVFTAIVGYSSYYIEYNFNGPGFVLKLSDMSTICFFVFLATMPEKKEIKCPLILFIILSGATLFIGYRNEFVVNILFIIIYVVTRDLVDVNGEHWIKKKYVVCLLIITPIMISVLYSISQIRVSDDGDNKFYLIGGVIDFFYQQGFSINIIKWEREFHDSMPENLYSIGQTIDFFKNGNVFSQLIFSIEPYYGQTVERALNGNQLSYYLSYMKFPWDYSMGYGVGSSYIAEAFHDFGYFGIAVFSSIYGIVMSRYKKYLTKNVWITTCFYIAITELLMAPRGYADAFFAQILNLTNIETFLIIIIISRLLRRH